MSQHIPEVLVTESEERQSLTASSHHESNPKINNLNNKRVSRTSVISKGSTGTRHLGPAHSSSHVYIGPKNASLETDSIGSAGSIMFDNRTPPAKRSTSTSLGYGSTDLDDEILVGDEKDFHDACRSGNLQVVEQLIKTDIDVNCRNKHDRTPLHWAAGNGHVEIMKALLDEGAAIDAIDKFGMDAVLWASWFGHKKCVQHMILAGAKSSSKNKHGYTWLHCAAQNNHIPVIELLNEEMQDFDKDTPDETGRSSMHVACKYGRTKVVEFLLKAGCHAATKDKSGNTPLHVAAKFGFPNLISPLAEAGSDLDAVNNNQFTPLHVAASEGKNIFCEELLKYNVDINCETEDETCPIHLAVSGGHYNATKVLIQHDADFDAGNKHNQTPLHFAVTGSNLEIVTLLTEAGAYTSVPDARSETPLHLAAENGLYDITEVLLLANSNHNAKDLRGKTPLDVAARGNYVMIVDMILKAERYRQYLLTQSPNDANNILSNISFKPDKNASSQHFRTLLFRLASKYLKRIEWKQLAFYWGFTDRQLQAIEEQYTGKKSFKEHGHRMLLIWYHGCVLQKQNPVKLLYEGLVGIQRRDLAELMRTKASEAIGAEGKGCSIS